jgi:hypothetical protein
MPPQNDSDARADPDRAHGHPGQIPVVDAQEVALLREENERLKDQILGLKGQLKGARCEIADSFPFSN